VRIDTTDTGTFEQAQRVQCTRVVDGTLDQNIDIGCRMKIHDQLTVIDHHRLDAGVLERLDQQLFFLADQRVQQTYL